MTVTTPPSRLRVGICLATVAACLPYLLLKLAWLLGWSIGVEDGYFATEAQVANLVTFALEASAIAVAVLLVAPVGRRLPGAVVALPAWVATGLLLPVAAGAVVGGALQALLGGGNGFAGTAEMAGWVFAVVYLGFALQGVFLLTGFALYAAARWPAARRVSGPVGEVPLVRLVTGIFVVGATAYVLQQAWWVAVSGGPFSDITIAQRTMLVASGIAAVAAVVAVLRTLADDRLTRGRVVAAWTGTAVVFATTFKDTLTAVTLRDGDWGATAVGPADTALTLLVLLTAVAGAVGCALRFVHATGDLSVRGSHLAVTPAP